MTLLTHSSAVSTSEAHNNRRQLAPFSFYVLYKLTMTSSIPNSFSSEDLQAMLDSAPKEEEMHTPAEDTSDSSEDILDALADEVLNSVPEEHAGPLVHKVMAMKVIARMIEWHTHMGESLHEDGDTESGTAWLRDAGKFQACFNILQSITVGRDDFTCPAE